MIKLNFFRNSLKGRKIKGMVRNTVEINITLGTYPSKFLYF